MALIAVEELIDANPWHGLRFGNLEPVQDGAIERYPVAGALYDVSVSARGLAVSRDRKPLFTADAPVEIRHAQFEGDRVRFELRSARPVKLRVGRGEPQVFQAGVTRGSGRY
jgi:hypothetical protein